MLTTVLIVIAIGVGVGLAGPRVVRWFFSRKRGKATIHTHAVVDRVRESGHLVGLEVRAKEIATSTQGWGALPPLLFSQAKLAMIFEFEKQYSVDLAQLRDSDIEHVGQGRVVLHMPTVEGSLRLLTLTPYDIQAGRVLGLLDVIPMNADRHGQLLEAAQAQAAELFEQADARYTEQARRSIEHRLRAVLRMVGVDAEFVWDADLTPKRTYAEPMRESGTGSSARVLTTSAA